MVSSHPANTVRRFLYVSVSTSEASCLEEAVRTIEASSKRNNELLSVSGALVFASGFFCQLIEGPSASIAQLITRLQSDHRHADIRVISDSPIGVRRMAGWFMVYLGSHDFVGPFLKRLHLHGPIGSDGERVEAVLRELATRTPGATKA